MGNFFEIAAGIFTEQPNSFPAAIHRYLLAGGDVFDRKLFRDFINNSSKFDDLDNILPIEFFKDPDLLARFKEPGIQVIRRFQSSGTTKQAKSESPFSQVGIELYKAAAVSGFFEALKRKFPQVAAKDLERMPGVSLIPGSDRWSTSSLAQMVTWIANSAPVKFAAEDDPVVAATTLRQLIKETDQPVWIFGTAFHFVNLIDEGFSTPLPPGSLIIETGGTKGRSRSVTRAELFSLISGAFSVAEDRIVSEYSMSELSAQAYDLGDGALTTRTYEFPAWVSLSVLDKGGAIKPEGTGALVINDPLRVDFPLPFRTEDIVQLKQGKFQILRRSQTAPLKGCSMFAERPATHALISDQKKISANAKVSPTNNKVLAMPDAARLARKIALSLFDHATVNAQFAREFRSERLASFAVADLKHSISGATFGIDPSIERQPWTIIAPGNHSLAAIHPILIAFVHGLEIAIRAPESFFAEGHYLEQLTRQLNEVRPGFATKLPADFYVNSPGDIWRNGKILVFGSDETVEHLASVAPGRICGFGDNIAIACATLAEIDTHREEIARDFFSLRQSGCMSPRLLALKAENRKELQQAVAVLAESTAPYKSELTVDDIAAISGENVRYRSLFPDLCRGSSQLSNQIFGVSFHPNQSVNSVVAQKPFVIPVLLIPSSDNDTFVNNLSSLVLPHLNVGLILSAPGTPLPVSRIKSAKNQARHLSFRSFGNAQSPAFSGWHEGHPLFVANH